MLIFKNRIVVTFTLGVQLYRTWVVVTGFKKKKKKNFLKIVINYFRGLKELNI